MNNLKPMIYCKGCTYPETAVNVKFDKNGFSSIYHTHKAWQNIKKEEWKKRKKIFEKIVLDIKKNNKSNYDCIIAVSGGKDSYYQTHVIKEYGLKPLLITYNGNNYSPEGEYNRDRMKKVFDADHLIISPSQEALIKLNRLGFNKVGDMNWHNHTGILTVPMQYAVRFKIPYVIYGETNDIFGIYKPSDYAEYTNRLRIEFAMRGFEWDEFIKNNKEGLVSKDMNWAKFPSDREMVENKTRGLYIGNYFKWDPNKNTKMIIKKYGWRPAKKNFERTYRKISNLDDIYENGIHDYLKFVKFGYGRATDHTTKDILTGYMNRNNGIDYVKKLDHKIPSDLKIWLNYTGMKEKTFWNKADTFRSPKVWWIKNNIWYKDNIWGYPSPYGPVHLSKLERKRYEV
jgi:N-acetyl sugar amidotransferase